MNKLEAVLRECAELTGKNAMVGVRAHKDDWWAHCDNQEWDGSTALQAAQSVLTSIRRQQKSKLHDLRSQVKALESKLEGTP